MYTIVIKRLNIDKSFDKILDKWIFRCYIVQKEMLILVTINTTNLI